MKENHSEKSIMDTPAAPWCSAHVPPDTNDSIGITELHKALEEPMDPHIPAVPFLRHSDLLQLRLCSQRHRHLAQHLTAPQDLRTPVQLCAHDPCGTLSCEQVCTSGTRMELQVNQVQASIIEKHGNDITENDAEEDGTTRGPSVPLALAWHRMASSENLADKYQLPADIYEAITKSVRNNTNLCEAIDQAERLTRAHGYWHGAPPEGLFDLFTDFAEYG